ncbi:MULTISPECIES: DUF1398 domain-containing protein [Staphylococcus]|jgi:uncharacterized protein YbcV (DUF1398 family)|uniref:DUF1398 domain-containing protein n=1 Tax=Staphylococcus shinii TaxID=2912228 RepID=A0A418IIK0_9STAP|nr:DUF1398 family protein [Staphylococcus shinii]MBO3065231.1 DUF1398 family protein [Staphylococcus shinii]MDW8563333.1 DUF1398 family protein [Staphylococcus shinii]MDW8566570.1 DUF1398 family protein [Staphylococcus shinii]MDW8569491.1 DUF1398 family protein [Staphylococcus shinii]MDW8571928.1 DUF1398 family protein [Staphylococcus shinii]
MTFSLSAIHQAHQQYTGVDFPKLFKAFKVMGITINTVDIQIGTTVYTHQNGEQIIDTGVKSTVPIAKHTDKEQVKEALVQHQAGETDFPTFCDAMAQSGVYKWHISIDAGTCAYINLNNEIVIIEQIPE